MIVVPGSTTTAIVPAITGKYFAKFENILGVQSLSAASVNFTKSNQDLTLIYDRKEDTDNPTFQGTFTNTEKYTAPNYSTPLNGIVLKGDILWDSVTSVDALNNWDFPNNVQSTGEYVFDNNLDLEHQFEVHFERRLAFTGFNVSTGAAVSDVDAKVYVRTTNDDPDSGSASFSAWQEFSSIMLNARGFEFKVVLTSSNTTSNICITELGVKGFMRTKTDISFIPIDSGTSAAKAVTYSSRFFGGVPETVGGNDAFKPAVNATLLNGQQGDFFTIDNQTIITDPAVGFVIRVKNSSGLGVDRQFVYQAIGLG